MVNRFPAADEFVSLRDAMDRLLADSFVSSPFRTLWSAAGGTGTGNGMARMPLPLDVYATQDEVVIVAAAPGLNPQDIEVTVNQGTVTFTGQTPDVAQSEEAKQATWFLHELPHGVFRRTVTLPFEIDAGQAEATFEHGVLRLRLPKAEQAKPRKIEIRAAESPSQITAGATK